MLYALPTLLKQWLVVFLCPTSFRADSQCLKKVKQTGPINNDWPILVWIHTAIFVISDISPCLFRLNESKEDAQIFFYQVLLTGTLTYCWYDNIISSFSITELLSPIQISTCYSNFPLKHQPVVCNVFVAFDSRNGLKQWQPGSLSPWKLVGSIPLQWWGCAP